MSIIYPTQTSDITQYDGVTLGISPSLPVNPGLNDVIEELDAAITAISVSETTTLASNSITMSSSVSGGSISISGGTTLTSALNSIVTQTATNETDISACLTKATYNAHTILYATTDDTPVALTVNASTVVGRKSTGNIVAMTMAELTTELNLTYRDSTDGFVRPYTNTDAFGVGAETTADKTLLIPLESATFANNPTIKWLHNIRNASDYGMVTEGYTSIELTTKFISNRNDNNLWIASDEAGANTKDQAIILSDDIDGATLRYWEIVKDGADSRAFKLNYYDGVSETTCLTLDVSGNLSLLGATTSVNDILDEDTMVSDSAVALCTQQSIKAYVDNELNTVNVSLGADITALEGAYDHTTDGANKRTRLAVGTFDYSDKSDTGTHLIFGSTDIPDNAIIIDAWIDVITAFTDDGANTTTIGVGVEGVGAGAEDIKIASAIGTDYTVSIKDEGNLDFSKATPVKLTAARDITLNIVLGGVATAMQTGKMKIYLLYIVSE